MDRIIKVGLQTVEKPYWRASLTCDNEEGPVFGLLNTGPFLLFNSSSTLPAASLGGWKGIWWSEDRNWLKLRGSVCNLRAINVSLFSVTFAGEMKNC